MTGKRSWRRRGGELERKKARWNRCKGRIKPDSVWITANDRRRNATTPGMDRLSGRLSAHFMTTLLPKLTLHPRLRLFSLAVMRKSENIYFVRWKRNPQRFFVCFFSFNCSSLICTVHLTQQLCSDISGTHSHFAAFWNSTNGDV